MKTNNKKFKAMREGLADWAAELAIEPQIEKASKHLPSGIRSGLNMADPSNLIRKVPHIGNPIKHVPALLDPVAIVKNVRANSDQRLGIGDRVEKLSSREMDDMIDWMHRMNSEQGKYKGKFTNSISDMRARRHKLMARTNESVESLQEISKASLLKYLLKARSSGKHLSDTAQKMDMRVKVGGVVPYSNRQTLERKIINRMVGVHVATQRLRGKGAGQSLVKLADRQAVKEEVVINEISAKLALRYLVRRGAIHVDAAKRSISFPSQQFQYLTKNADEARFRSSVRGHATKREQELMRVHAKTTKATNFALRKVHNKLANPNTTAQNQQSKIRDAMLDAERERLNHARLIGKSPTISMQIKKYAHHPTEPTEVPMQPGRVKSLYHSKYTRPKYLPPAKMTIKSTEPRKDSTLPPEKPTSKTQIDPESGTMSIKKKPTSEGVINELSPSTMVSYIKKAEPAFRRVATPQRAMGIKRAIKGLRKEEAINELSGKTLASYFNKAHFDLKTRANKIRAMVDIVDGLPQNIKHNFIPGVEKGYKKMELRHRGMGIAHQKLDRKGYTEETVINEVSPKVLFPYLEKAVKSSDRALQVSTAYSNLARAGKLSYKTAARNMVQQGKVINKREVGMKRAVDRISSSIANKIKNEEKAVVVVPVINEVSKRLLSRYIYSVNDALPKMRSQLYDDPDNAKLWYKLINRSMGRDLAQNKYDGAAPGKTIPTGGKRMQATIKKFKRKVRKEEYSFPSPLQETSKIKLLKYLARSSKSIKSLDKETEKFAVRHDKGQLIHEPKANRIMHTGMKRRLMNMIAINRLKGKKAGDTMKPILMRNKIPNDMGKRLNDKVLGVGPGENLYNMSRYNKNKKKED